MSMKPKIIKLRILLTSTNTKILVITTVLWSPRGGIDKKLFTMVFSFDKIQKKGRNKSDESNESESDESDESNESNESNKREEDQKEHKK